MKSKGSILTKILIVIVIILGGLFLIGFIRNPSLDINFSTKTLECRDKDGQIVFTATYPSYIYNRDFGNGTGCTLYIPKILYYVNVIDFEFARSSKEYIYYATSTEGYKKFEKVGDYLGQQKIGNNTFDVFSRSSGGEGLYYVRFSNGTFFEAENYSGQTGLNILQNVQFR